ncbi:dephospho-CoA kinase [Sphingomonas quercus]|uniref:Dephospho-CoA kinase n=1 Tax=Sphingomonas quercus TaxID=2842451 RepID=A0ABS6BF48_9SPHN|nr:dephospho-CoA kinase [Sphingomonas quercus]MBU3076922.1 dephospho-CoA kinase [Sphingomonas quercus]
MIVLGLTGSIGMGKSTVAAMFRRAGVPVWDADAAVHALQGPGGRLLPAIEARFPGTTGPAGVDRAALGARALADRAELRALEAIVHPAVAAERRAFLRRYRARRLVVLDVPLLLERRLDRLVDAVVVVSAPAWRQRARVLARPGMNSARFAATLRHQMPDRAKRARADFVIDTGLSRLETATQVRALVACMAAHGVRYCRGCARLSSTPKRPD